MAKKRSSRSKKQPRGTRSNPEQFDPKKEEVFDKKTGKRVPQSRAYTKRGFLKAGLGVRNKGSKRTKYTTASAGEGG